MTVSSKMENVSSMFIFVIFTIICVINTQEIGKVFLVVPAEEINSTDLTNSSSYLFSLNDASGRLPIFIEVYNSTDPSLVLPVRDEVAITCEVNLQGIGYSSIIFTPITLNSTQTYGEVPFSIVEAGREVPVSCFGDSTIFATEPQFTNLTSRSDQVLIAVTRSATVNFCDPIIVLQNEQNLVTTFRVQFSEAVQDNVVQVYCELLPAVLPPDGSLPINMTIDAFVTADIGATSAQFVYSIITEGSDRQVHCFAESINGSQFINSTSGGGPATLTLTTGTITLLPGVKQVERSSFTAILSLDSPAAIPISFTCITATVTTPTEAEDQTRRVVCEIPTVPPGSSTSTTTASTTPINISTNDTTIIFTNDTTDPVTANTTAPATTDPPTTDPPTTNPPTTDPPTTDPPTTDPPTTDPPTTDPPTTESATTDVSTVDTKSATTDVSTVDTESATTDVSTVDTESATTDVSTVDTTVLDPTVTAAVTLPVNGTTNIVTTNNVTWTVQQPVDIKKSDAFTTVELRRSDPVTSEVRELVVLMCCTLSAKYVNQTASMVASIQLQPDQPIDWAAAVPPVETVLGNVAYTNIAPCPCDMIQKSCDVECCCDTDCIQSYNESFSSCIDGLPGGGSLPTPERSCQSRHFSPDDWFPFLCVQWERSPYLGLYYPSETSISDSEAFNAKTQKAGVQFTYRESGSRNIDEPGSENFGYKTGLGVETGRSNEDGSVSSLRGLLTLPQSLLGGECQRYAPVRFLHDLDTKCSYTLTPELCSSDSILSASMYAEATTINNPPCPRAQRVLSEHGGTQVTETKARYLCATDTSKYLNSLQDFSDFQSATQRSLFNYDLPVGNCTDRFGNDVCTDFNSIPDASIEPLPPLCIWDDGYTKPVVPHYDEATNTCQNAVLDVHYNFTWSGTSIIGLTAFIILGDLPLEVTREDNRTVTYSVIIPEQIIIVNITDDNNVTSEVNVTIPARPETRYSYELSTLSVAAVLTQNYQAIFHHDITRVIRNDTASDNFYNTPLQYDRSGNPGFEFGKPIFSGTSVVNSTTGEFLYVNTNSTRQMALWDTSPDNLCTSAGRRSLTFGDDVASGCVIRLAYSDFTDCLQLRRESADITTPLFMRLLMNRLNTLMPSDLVGRYGYNNPVDITYWVPVLRQDLSDIFPPLDANTTNLDASQDSNFTYIHHDREAICPNVTSGVHISIMYAETGKTNGASIWEINGARVNYTLTTWELFCSGSNNPRCQNMTDSEGGVEYVQPFTVESSIRFIEVPAQTPVSEIRFWSAHDPEFCQHDSCLRFKDNFGRQYCHYDACMSQIVYPLTDAYIGETQIYTMAFFLVSVLFFIGYVMITWPC